MWPCSHRKDDGEFSLECLRNSKLGRFIRKDSLHEKSTMSRLAAFLVSSRYCLAINKDSLPAVKAAHSESLSLQVHSRFRRAINKRVSTTHYESVHSLLMPNDTAASAPILQDSPCQSTKKDEADFLPKYIKGLSTRTAIHTNDTYKHLLNFSFMLLTLLIELPRRQPRSYTRTVQKPWHISYTAHTRSLQASA